MPTPYTPSPSLMNHLKRYEGTVKHDNLHRIYDDKSNGKNFWDGKVPYDTWRATSKGYPTIGYGSRFDLMPPAMQQFIRAKGGIPDALADRQFT